VCGEESGGDGVVSDMVEEEVGYLMPVLVSTRSRHGPRFIPSSTLIRLHSKRCNGIHSLP